MTQNTENEKEVREALIALGKLVASLVESHRTLHGSSDSATRPAQAELPSLSRDLLSRIDEQAHAAQQAIQLVSGHQ
jgi:hypothetical protein